MIGGAVFLGIWGIVHGNDDGWTSARVLLPLVVAALLVPSYVVHARSASRRDYAVLPLRLFESRGFTVANVIGLSFTVGMFGAVFLLAQNLQIVQGYSPFEAGLRTLPWTAAPMVVAPIAGMLAPRTGLRALLVVGLVLQTVSLVWLALVTEAGSGYASFVPGLVMAGVGMGLTFAPSATAVLDGLPDGDFGTASSANSTIREFGVALGVAGLTAVFLGNGGELTPTGYDGAIGPALLVGAGTVAVAAVAAFFAPGREGPLTRVPGSPGNPAHPCCCNGRGVHVYQGTLVNRQPSSGQWVGQRGSELVRQPPGPAWCGPRTWRCGCDHSGRGRRSVVTGGGAGRGHRLQHGRQRGDLLVARVALDDEERRARSLAQAWPTTPAVTSSAPGAWSRRAATHGSPWGSPRWRVVRLLRCAPPPQDPPPRLRIPLLAARSLRSGPLTAGCSRASSAGSVSRLDRSSRSARTISPRVSCGWITASM